MRLGNIGVRRGVVADAHDAGVLGSLENGVLLMMLACLAGEGVLRLMKGCCG